MKWMLNVRMQYSPSCGLVKHLLTDMLTTQSHPLGFHISHYQFAEVALTPNCQFLADSLCNLSPKCLPLFTFVTMLEF